MLGPVTAPAFLEIPDAATGARQIPLTGAGVMLGADAACDVVLPGLAAPPPLAAALASGSDARRRLEQIAEEASGAPVGAEYLVKRLAQFCEECDVIVPGVADALRARDLATVGALVDRSQALAEQALENQVPETISLARIAREQGAAAASAFGAGFGGAVWAMVARDGADEFIERWKTAFGGAHPDRAARARFLLTMPGAPAGSGGSRG